jgi:hypothetical protein
MTWAALPSRFPPPPWSVEELDACFVVRDYGRCSAGLLLFQHTERQNRV